MSSLLSLHCRDDGIDADDAIDGGGAVDGDSHCKIDINSELMNE